MSATISRVEYFHATVRDRPGETFGVLEELAGSGVDLLAFSAVPLGHLAAQLVLFPRDPDRLVHFADASGLVLSGPERALLVQGDDELGALVQIHRRLSEASVNVAASNGVTDGRGGYGYVVYVRPEEYETACVALGV